MVFTIIDTPRTEVGDQTRMSGFNDLDLSTQQSMPSPSKDGNDLLKQIRGMRPSTTQTPLARLPFGDRRNLPSKAEFTPLLKSAARNNHRRVNGERKENARSSETPTVFRRPLAADSPALPFNSSVMLEDNTGSDHHDADGTSLAPPITSSSIASTPIAPSHRGEGPLDARGNVATLREQEARLEQIDKENFSLKLKIHFMEEALRKNGKEFNETAIRENTELKVDKVTLQRDLKHYRKLLSKAEKDLEDYRQQLKDYMGKVNRRHVSESMQEELDELRKTMASKEEEIKSLQENVSSSEDLKQQVDKLQGDCDDLEAELREKDRELDEKDEQLEKLRDDGSRDDELAEQLREKEKLLEERETSLDDLKEQLEQIKNEADRLASEKQLLLDEKDRKLRDLEAQLESAAVAQSSLASREQELASKEKLLRQKDEEIERLRQELYEGAGDKSIIRTRDRDAASKQSELDDLRVDLKDAERRLGESEDSNQQLQTRLEQGSSERRQLLREAQDKDGEIRTLQQKLESANGVDEQTDKLHDHVADLEAELREKERLVNEKADEIDSINETLQKEKQEADEDIQACEDRIQQLEGQDQRNLQELQALRDADDQASSTRTQAAERAQSRVRELEQQHKQDKEREQSLQKDINQLHDRIWRLDSSVKDKDTKFAAEQERWASERRSLEASKSRAEQQAAGLQRTIDRLQEAEGTLSGRELQLQRALENEKQRFGSETESLRGELAETQAESDKHWQSLQDAKTSLRDAEDTTSKTQQQLEKVQAEQTALREQIESMEDEIEVLQTGMDEDTDRVKDDLAASKQEVEALRRQLRGLQQDLATVQIERDQAEADLKSHRTSGIHAISPSRVATSQGSRTQNQEMQNRLSDLGEELTRVKRDRESLQRRVAEAERAQEDARANLDTLQLDLDTSSGSRTQLQQKLKDVQQQLTKAKKDKAEVEEDLAATNADLDILQTSTTDLRADLNSSHEATRDLKSQLQSAKRDHDRALQSQSFRYEQDIANLEQDLASAVSKTTTLDNEKTASNQQIARLQSKTSSLESQLTILRTTRATSDTSVAERKDLHEMLKDAKLEAEDLALQITDRDARITSAAAKEAELRSQMKRLRDERAAQSSRADAIGHDLSNLQIAYDTLISEMSDLRKSNRAIKHSTTIASQTSSDQDVITLQKRHNAELRSLASQIEYLGARCKREERFRADLSYIKTYFMKQVEMHGAWTLADLKLVAAMGIPTAEVVTDEGLKKGLDIGRTPTKSANTRVGMGKGGGRRWGDRPSLRCVCLMVLAGCRMQRLAGKWSEVHRVNEGLVKKLRETHSIRRSKAVV